MASPLSNLQRVRHKGYVCCIELEVCWRTALHHCEPRAFSPSGPKTRPCPRVPVVHTAPSHLREPVLLSISYVLALDSAEGWRKVEKPGLR
jgi:hypothetical protein